MSNELNHKSSPKGISKGKAWIFGDNINTDIIIPFRFKSRTNDPNEMAKYAMYGYDPDFHKKISNGDVIVAGRNFGGGSSREQAPVALKYAGISAVIAQSFARIFYRNSFTVGLPALEIPEIKGKIKQRRDCCRHCEIYCIQSCKWTNISSQTCTNLHATDGDRRGISRIL